MHPAKIVPMPAGTDSRGRQWSKCPPKTEGAEKII
jgi:hypothetical protein